MAKKKTEGLPNFGIDLNKKAKKKKLSTTDATLVRKARTAAKHRELAKHRESIKPKVKEIITKPIIPPKMKNVTTEVKEITQHNTLPLVVQGPATTTSRFDKMVQRVSQMKDIQKLKKIIYNRNYRLRKQFEKLHPEAAAENKLRQFPPQEDIRIVGAATLRRLHKIKDPDKLLEELKKLVINTTRRKNVPKTTGDFSNKEQDYLQNGVNELKNALGSWGDDMLARKLSVVFDKLTVIDIQNIFEEAPSYWAISAGYYYAVEKFDNFMNEIFDIINKYGVPLTGAEQKELKERLFNNDPRTHGDKK